MPSNYDHCLGDAKTAALVAWKQIHHFHRSELVVHQKAEGPVTEADRLADKIIVKYLEERHPREQNGFLSEEYENDPIRLQRDRVWIIDPIDGTQDFVKGRDDFAIHIGLVECHGDEWLPIVAVVYHPLAGMMYSATRGGGAWVEQEPQDESHWWTRGLDPQNVLFNRRTPLKVSANSAIEKLTAVVSKSHPTKRLEATLEALPLHRYYQRGSLGVKLMEVASARADFYINTESRRCKEWDTCAPQLILEESGGRVTDLSGNPIKYNQPDVVLDGGILATNGHSHHVLLDALGKIPALRQ